VNRALVLQGREIVDIVVDGNNQPRDPLSEARAVDRRRAFDRMVLRWLRACARCGSILPPIDLFCGRCAVMLASQQNRGPALLQPGFAFPVYSLFTWTHANDTVMRPFLHAFKRGLAVREAESMGLLFLHEISSQRPRLSPWIAHPGGKSGRDHSWLLAQLLARLIAPEDSLPIVTLRLADAGLGGSQKLKSASERRSRRFIKEEKFSGRNVPWVFVDDVITTGSTARAAWQALGQPDSFEVWTLACRPKLAGKPSFW